MPAIDAVRSMLFAPGDRPDLITKAAKSAADAVIVDLEDAVATSAKDAARANLTARPDSALPFFVRVNGFGSGAMWKDLAAAVEAGVEGVILPKVGDSHHPHPGQVEGRPGVEGVILPKVGDSKVMLKACGALSGLEAAAGRPEGSITLIPPDRDRDRSAERRRDLGWL